ncbi:MAG: peptide deformylase [Gemmataceae bacterium]
MKIVHYPHPALRHPSRPLTAIDGSVRKQAAQMLELMYEARGIGLAANQVAWPYQLLVFNETADPEQREHEFVCINPVILERKGSLEGEEGCLSFPMLYQKVRRAKTVKVQYYNLEGQAVVMEASDLVARVVQHEVDHLQGVLFIDRMGFLAKRACRNSLAEFERQYRLAQKKGEIPSDEEIAKILASAEVPAL